MAMTSTQFMAAPGGFSATLSNKLDKIDCSQVLAAILVADKELLGHIKMGDTAHNIEVNWIEDELNAAYVIASSSNAGYVTMVTPAAAASVQRLLRQYSILQPAGSELAWRITDATLSTTIAGGIYGSTTWASWTSTKCYIIQQPYADISDASDDVSLSRTKRKNFMQVFERAVQIAQTRKNMDMEAVTSELQLQIARRTMEIKRELDMSIIRGYGNATASNVFSADTELRTMCGIMQLLRDPNLDTTNEDTMVTQISTALVAGHINSLAHKIWDAGGLDDSADPIIVVAAGQARVIAAMERDIRRTEHGERMVGYYKNVFLTDMGIEMPVVMDRWMPKDKLLILDRSRIRIRPMAGDNWHMEKMAKTGRNEKWQLSGQFTLELRNANACHGMLYDLT